MYYYHAGQRTKKNTSLLQDHYTWICILGILSITEDIRSCPILSRLPFARNRSCWWSRAAIINQPVQLQTRIYQMILSSWFYDRTELLETGSSYGVFVHRRTKISRILRRTRISRAHRWNKIILRQETLLFTDSSLQICCRSSWRIRSSWDRRRCFLQTALHRSLVEAAEE